MRTWWGLSPSDDHRCSSLLTSQFSVVTILERLRWLRRPDWHCHLPAVMWWRTSQCGRMPSNAVHAKPWAVASHITTHAASLVGTMRQWSWQEKLLTFQSECWCNLLHTCLLLLTRQCIHTIVFTHKHIQSYTNTCFCPLRSSCYNVPKNISQSGSDFLHSKKI